jgi:threonine/homoserine/homoserine lactone efflux protein
MTPVEVIADLSLVDDEERPGVVGVGWIGVLEELGVEDLSDAGYGRPPRANVLTRAHARHAKNVQDVAGPVPCTRVHGAPGMVRDIEALVVFALVSSGTPGPNNVLLWASGFQFGFRPTVPQILGTSIGIGSLAVAVAAGIGFLVTAVPEVELTLKLVGSAYLLFLAVQLAGGHAIRRAQIARPLRLHQAVTFQFLNPKAWLFALAAIGTFRPDGLPVAVGSALVVLVMMIVVLPTAALWAVGGTALHRVSTDDLVQRTLSVALAVLLALSIAFIWI